VRRELLGPYLLVGGGLLGGLFVGVFVVDTSPSFLGWLFGAGVGITFGAFIAALTTGEQLAGGRRPGKQLPPLFEPVGSPDHAAEPAEEEPSAAARLNGGGPQA
jgi:hypothetical protein